MTHTAATPVGMTVTATARVTGMDGRTIRFALEARDDIDVIGAGTHDRVVVNVARFDVRVQEKRKKRRWMNRSPCTAQSCGTSAARREKMTPMRLTDIQAKLGGEVIGDANTPIMGVGIAGSRPRRTDHVSGQPEVPPQTSVHFRECGDRRRKRSRCHRLAAHCCQEPVRVFCACCATVLATNAPTPDIHPQAAVHATAQVHASARIAEFVSIGAGAKLVNMPILVPVALSARVQRSAPKPALCHV